MNFRKFLTACCLSVCALQFSAPQAQAGIHLDVNVGIGAPGYYGILPIQGVMPQVWNSSPVIAVGSAIAGEGRFILQSHWNTESIGDNIAADMMRAQDRCIS